MKHHKGLALGILASLTLLACGGGGDGIQTSKVKFSALVSFGDSLSDVGTYKVGTVSTLGGGRYTINSGTDKNWTELLAAQIGVAAPCPAQTGLDGDVKLGFSVAVQNFNACRNYAQGGARVTQAYGPGHKQLGADDAILGQLTVPVSTQIAKHLGVAGGSFAGTELVTVATGANDLFMQLKALEKLSTAPAAFADYAVSTVGWDAADATAVLTASTPAQIQQAAASTAVSKMALAGKQLAGLVKANIVGNGAKYVLVLNIPNVSKSPLMASYDPSTIALVDSMTQAFNNALQAGLAGTAGVKFGDIYATNTDQIANPAQYGLSNVKDTACNLSVNTLKSSLVCNTNNVIAGDVSRYLFADQVHPTPYGQKLISQDAAKYLTAAGWL